MSIIEVDTIVGADFIIPVYTKTSTVPDCHIPNYEDRFFGMLMESSLTDQVGMIFTYNMK